MNNSILDGRIIADTAIDMMASFIKNFEPSSRDDGSHLAYY